MRTAPLCLLLVPWLAWAAPSEPPACPWASTRFKSQERSEQLAPLSPPTRGGPKKGRAHVTLAQHVRAGTLPGGLTPQELALLREVEALSRSPPSGRWYSSPAAAARGAAPGWELPDYVADLLCLSGATLSPAKGPGVRGVKSLGRGGSGKREERSNLQVLQGRPPAVEKASLTWNAVLRDRWSEDTTAHVLAVFEEGRLARLVEWRRDLSWDADPYDGESDAAPTFSASLLVPTWRDGKVWRLERRVWQERKDEESREDLSLSLRTTTFEAPAR